MSIWINILNKKKEDEEREERRIPLYAPIYNDYPDRNPYDNKKKKKKSIKNPNKRYPETIDDFEVDLDISEDFNVTKIGSVIQNNKEPWFKFSCK